MRASSCRRCCFDLNRLHFLALFTWLFAMFFATQILFTIFANYTPPWRCNERYTEGENITTQPSFDINGAQESSGRDNNSQLAMLATTTSGNAAAGGYTRDCAVYRKCGGVEGGRLEFDTNYFHSAAVEFEGWTCTNRPVYLTMTQFIGVFLGAILFGAISDRLGRRRISIGILTLGISTLLISGLIANEALFFGCRFLVGSAVGGTLVVIYTYTMEMLLPKQRLPQRAFFNWGLARLMLTITCFVFPDWRDASIASAFLSLPALFALVFLLPESPAWIQQQKWKKRNKGKSLIHRCPSDQSDHHEASACWNIAGQMNINQAYHKAEHTHDANLHSGHQLSFRELFTNRSFLRRISVLWVMFFVGTLSGYVTDLNSPNLSGNLFVNQALFPALIALSKMVLVFYSSIRPNFSRRNLHQYSQTVVIGCYLLLTVNTAWWGDRHGPFTTTTANITAALVLALNLIGTVFIEYTWDANYLCAVELMPTEMRATAIGSCSTMGRVGMLLAPLLLQLNHLWSPSAYALVCVLGTANLAISYKWLLESKDVDLNEVNLFGDSGSRRRRTFRRAKPPNSDAIDEKY